MNNEKSESAGLSPNISKFEIGLLFAVTINFIFYNLALHLPAFSGGDIEELVGFFIPLLLVPVIGISFIVAVVRRKSLRYYFLSASILFGCLISALFSDDGLTSSLFFNLIYFGIISLLILLLAWYKREKRKFWIYTAAVLFCMAIGLFLFEYFNVPTDSKTTTDSSQTDVNSSAANPKINSAKENLQTLIAKAETGSADAQYSLGQAYLDGELTKQDYEQAVLWFQKSAEQNNAKAQLELANLYYFGSGVPENKNTAVVLIKRAAESGNADAQNKLGVFYGQGVVVKKDTEEERIWYKKAADQGNVIAIRNIGISYFNDDNYANAVEWYRKGVELNDGPSNAYLGSAYKYGRGIKKDLSKAYELFKKAADLGDKHGMFLLGEAHFMGEGTSINPEEGIRWMQMAAVKGSIDARKKLKILGREW